MRSANTPGIVRGKLAFLDVAHGRMRREVHRMSDRLACRVLDAQHQQLAIDRLVLALGVAIAVERNLLRRHAHPRRLQRLGRVEDDLAEFLFELTNVGALRRRPLVQFENGAVVRVRGDEENVFNAGRF